MCGYEAESNGYVFMMIGVAPRVILWKFGQIQEALGKNETGKIILFRVGLQDKPLLAIRRNQRLQVEKHLPPLIWILQACANRQS